MPDQMVRQLVYAVILGYALNRAQIIRLEMPQYQANNSRVLTRIKKVVGEAWYQKAIKVADIYTYLPALPTNEKSAISLFSNKAGQAAKILGFSITPYLAKDKNGMWYWKS